MSQSSIVTEFCDGVPSLYSWLEADYSWISCNFLKVNFNGYSYILTSTEQPIVQGGFLLTSLYAIKLHKLVFPTPNSKK